MKPAHDNEFVEAVRQFVARGLCAHYEPRWGAIRVFRHPRVPGNARTGYSVTLFLSVEPVVELVLDAPFGWLSLTEEGRWQFYIEACIPRGPGDHCWMFDSVDLAIESAVDYFFGHPARMCQEWQSSLDSGLLER